MYPEGKIVTLFSLCDPFVGYNQNSNSDSKCVSISVVPIFRINYLSNINVNKTLFTILSDEPGYNGGIQELINPHYHGAVGYNVTEWMHYGMNSIKMSFVVVIIITLSW